MADNPTTLWIGYDANGRVPSMLTHATGYCPKTGLPVPKADEMQHHFFARCMGNHAMMQQFPGYKARSNHALRRWHDGTAIKMAANEQQKPLPADTLDDSGGRTPHPDQQPAQPVKRAKEENQLFSFHGINDLPKAQYDEWKAAKDSGNCPWCKKGLSNRHNNANSHLRSCGNRPCPPAADDGSTPVQNARVDSSGKPVHRWAIPTASVAADEGYPLGGYEENFLRDTERNRKDGPNRGRDTLKLDTEIAPEHQKKARAGDYTLRDEDWALDPDTWEGMTKHMGHMDQGKVGEGTTQPESHLLNPSRKNPNAPILHAADGEPVRYAADVPPPAHVQPTYASGAVSRKPGEPFGAYQARIRGHNASQGILPSDRMALSIPRPKVAAPVRPAQHAKDTPATIEELDDLLEAPVRDAREFGSNRVHPGDTTASFLRAKQLRQQVEANQQRLKEEEKQLQEPRQPRPERMTAKQVPQRTLEDLEDEDLLLEDFDEGDFGHDTRGGRRASSRMPGTGAAQYHGHEHEQFDRYGSPLRTQQLGSRENREHVTLPQHVEEARNTMIGAATTTEPTSTGGTRTRTEHPSGAYEFRIKPGPGGGTNRVTGTADERANQLASAGNIAAGSADPRARRPFAERNAKQDTIAAPAKRRQEFGTQLPRQPKSDVGRVYAPRGGAVEAAAKNDEKNYYRGLNESVKHAAKPKAATPQYESNILDIPEKPRLKPAARTPKPKAAVAPKPKPQPISRPATEPSDLPDRLAEIHERDYGLHRSPATGKEAYGEKPRHSYANTVMQGMAGNANTQAGFNKAAADVPTSGQSGEAARPKQQTEGFRNILRQPTSSQGKQLETTLSHMGSTNQGNLSPQEFRGLHSAGLLKEARQKSKDEERYVSESDDFNGIGRQRPNERKPSKFTDIDLGIDEDSPLYDYDKPAKSARQPSAGISPEKAKQILRDGEVRGHPLTPKQRGMFGAAAGHDREARTPTIHPEDVAKYNQTEKPQPDFDWYAPPPSARRKSDFYKPPAAEPPATTGTKGVTPKVYDPPAHKPTRTPAPVAKGVQPPPPPAAKPTKVQKPQTEVDWAAATAAGPKPKQPGVGMRIAQGLDEATEDFGKFMGTQDETGKHRIFQDAARKLGFSKQPTSQLGKAMYARAEQLSRQGMKPHAALAACGLAGCQR
jgi:hypothetical protein